MLRYLFKRLLLVVLALAATNFGAFAYAHLARSGVGNPYFAEARRANPLFSAYGDYFTQFFGGEGVASVRYGNEFLAVMAQATGASLVLLALALVISVVLGYTLGLAGVRKSPPGIRNWLIALSTLGLATPSFFIGSLAVAGILAATIWGPFETRPLPIQGYGLDTHLVLPVLVLCVRPVAQIAHYVAALTAGELGKPYVTAARGKGLTWERATRHHALRNVYAPLIQVVSRTLRLIVGELILVEWLFGWPGLGFLLAETLIPGRMTGSSVEGRFLDPPLVATVLTILAAFFLLLDTAAAVAVRRLDPRQRGSH